MTASKTTDAYQLDLSAPALETDPYQTYARLRANRGVHYWTATPAVRFPVLSRYADVRFALRDPRFGPGPHDHTQPLGRDGHRLSAVDVQRVRQNLPIVVTTLLGELAHRSSFELIAEFAEPLSTHVMGDLSHVMAEDDLVSGHAMIVNLIGNGALALLNHRDQLAWLRATPERADAAVEELLRFDCPMQRTQRAALADIELPEGDIIEAGEAVTILIGAANRDYSQFAEPDRLDLDRPNAHRHLAFGSGGEVCVGAALARLEAEIALAALVRCLPNLHLADPAPAWRSTSGLRGLQALYVTC
ncbi:MAG TPA: cytochrome P450 [Chloroflexota bacterium]